MGSWIGGAGMCLIGSHSRSVLARALKQTLGVAFISGMCGAISTAILTFPSKSLADSFVSQAVPGTADITADITDSASPAVSDAATLTAQEFKPISNSYSPPTGVLLAQLDGDDTYDPFSDYSEFEESAEEEEDINFFRNGRLLTLGFTGGMRFWTDNLGKMYSVSPGFGLFLSYFFDLRFALQVGFLTSDHTLLIKGADFATIQGAVSVSDLAFLLKYYFNTQNVTRGLADLNPYLLGGFSQIYRTTTLTGVDNPAKDSAFGFNVGAGLEIPMLRNKMFFGLQANYQLISFANEGQVVLDENDVKTGVTPSGDSFLVLGVIGVNF